MNWIDCLSYRSQSLASSVLSHSQTIAQTDTVEIAIERRPLTPDKMDMGGHEERYKKQELGGG